MILTQGLVEGPVLDCLFKFASRPRPDDAVRALGEAAVQDAALAVAERMRQLAKQDDEERLVLHKSLNNYRRFYVGGLGIGVVTTGNYKYPYDWWAFAASNSKSSKNACKFCAEMRIIRAAKEVPCACVGGLVVLGENQPDGRSGELRKTLDPCGNCRDMMRAPENLYLFRRRTLIMTAKPLSQVRYVESLPKMMEAHGETWP